MRETCPYCGGEQVVSRDPIPWGGPDHRPLVAGIEHLVCPSCGEIEFTPAQLRELPPCAGQSGDRGR